jgi:hypothetical protein
MVSPVQSKLIQASLTPAALGAEISSTIAAKAQTAQKQEGAAVLKLLENAGAPQQSGGTNDLGGTLDITA